MDLKYRLSVIVDGVSQRVSCSGQGYNSIFEIPEGARKISIVLPLDIDEIPATNATYTAPRKQKRGKKDE